MGFHNSATSLDLGLLCGPLILVDEAAEDRAAFDPLPVVVGRVLVQDCPQMRAGRRTARIERRQVLGGLISPKFPPAIRVLQKLNGWGLCLRDHSRRACVNCVAGGSTPEI